MLSHATTKYVICIDKKLCLCSHYCNKIIDMESCYNRMICVFVLTASVGHWTFTMLCLQSIWRNPVRSVFAIKLFLGTVADL